MFCSLHHNSSRGADDGISLVGGVLYGRGGIVLAIIRDGQSLDARRHISEPYIADCPFGLADGLDNSSGGGHGETAAHIILVLEDALFEELVGAGRGLARVNHDLAVVASHLFPVGYFSAEDVFQLPAGEFFTGLDGCTTTASAS